MKIIGHIKLKNPLTVKPECLDKEFDFSIDSILGKLRTPKLPQDSSGLETGQNLEEPGLDRFFNEEIFWGRVIQWSDGRSHVYNLKIEFEVNDESKVQEIGNKLYQGIPNWTIRLRDNLSVFGHNLDLPTNVQKKAELEKGYFDLFYKTAHGVERPFTPISVIDLIVVGSEGISYANLYDALKFTSEGKRPILELSLLSEANISLLEGNYRKSILDSSTAFELSLTNYLKRNLKIDQPLLDEFLRLNNSISKKRSILRLIGISLPNHNYSDDLENLRNRAIHIGKEPNSDEARKAFLIATEVVNLLSRERIE